MPSRAYKKGYSTERHCQLTLEYNNYHVKRNTMSIGIEDVMAFKGGVVYLIQCKNTKRGEKSMTRDEKAILIFHAAEQKAFAVYMYKDGRGKYRWLDLSNRCEMTLLPYTKEWYRERMKMREMLRKMKKKNLNDYTRYVLKNWDKVKDYIC